MYFCANLVLLLWRTKYRQFLQRNSINFVIWSSVL